jgi:putative tRNA adenosine deaminase-associated protein
MLPVCGISSFAAWGPVIWQLSPRAQDVCGMTMTESATDFAVVAYRDEGRWEAEVLPAVLTEDLSGLIHTLRQQPSTAGTIGFVGVGDDFFIAVRVMGPEASVFLSDVTAAADWPLAAQVLHMLDIPVPDDEDLDQVLPAGDLSIFADMGLEEWELCAIAGDLDLFPDEAVASIAGRLKFREPMERALEVALGP